MAKTYRIGFASLVHDHVWGELRHWKSHPNVEIVAAGDVNAELRTQFHNETGVENIYNSWQEMIEKEELDIVQASAENNAGADIVEAAAAKGVHVVSEKPMAAAPVASGADGCCCRKCRYFTNGELAHGMESRAQYGDESHQRRRNR